MLQYLLKVFSPRTPRLCGADFRLSGLLAPAQLPAQDIEVIVAGRMDEPQVMVVSSHLNPVPGIQGEGNLPVTGDLGLQRAFVDDNLDT
jgi:hypothetical protein